jgi:O-antigen/teichoic acid export membrane protein
MVTIKNLVKEAIIYSFMGLLPRLLGLLLIPLLTRRFTPEENGVIDLSITITILLVIIFNLGLDSSLIRSVNNSNGYRNRDEHFSTVFWFRLLFYIVVQFLVIQFAPNISILFFRSSEYMDVVTWSVASAFTGSLWMLFMQLYRLQHKSSSFFVFSCIKLVIAFGLTLYLVIINKMGIPAIFMGAAYIDGLFVILLALSNRHSLLSPKFRLLGKMAGVGLLLLPSAVLFYLLQYIDRYFIQGYLGFEQLGIYGIGFRLTVFVSLLISGFESVWLPFLWRAQQQTNGNALIESVYKLFTMSLAFISLAIGIFSREILAVVGTDAYSQAANFVYLLVIAISVYYSTHYFCIGLEITEKTYHRLIGGALAAGSSIILNRIFIPQFGIVGAAWVFLISCLIYGIYVILVSQKLYYIEYHLERYFGMITIFLGCAYLMTWITTISPGLVAIKLLALFSVSLATPILLGFIGWEGLARFILNLRKASLG